MMDVKGSNDRPRRGGILAWLVICFLVVCGVLVFGGLFIASHIRVHEDVAGNDVRVETPFGSVHVQNGKGQRSASGLPVYPGAKAVRGHDNATVDLSSMLGGQELHVVSGKWETPDSIERVQKYYEDKFPEMSVIQHSGRVEMHGGSEIGQRVIVLRDTGGRTEISLASVGEPKAN
jgi:hypothetical protein